MPTNATAATTKRQGHKIRLMHVDDEPTDVNMTTMYATQKCSDW